MPKRRSPDKNHHTYRVELQQHERDALDMVAASQTFKNVSDGIGAIITPFTQCSVAGSIMALTIFETLLFTQDKGLIKSLFGIGEDVGEYTYQGASDLVSRIQRNYENNKESRGEAMNPDHKTEMSEREALIDFQETAVQQNISWNPIRGGWVDPVTGRILSTDRNDPLYA